MKKCDAWAVTEDAHGNRLLEVGGYRDTGRRIPPNSTPVVRFESAAHLVLTPEKTLQLISALDDYGFNFDGN